ncbi:MAG: hypothetical protein AABM29_07030 [Actinomycetota bacterium]
MNTQKHTVQLTNEQIAFLRESLDYSAKAFRDADYTPQGQEWAAEHRREREEMIADIRTALAESSPPRTG